MSTAEPYQLHTTKWFKNPISGHEWPEHTFINKWSVLGGNSINEPKFNSLLKAQEHADWLNKIRQQSQPEVGMGLKNTGSRCMTHNM